MPTHEYSEGDELRSSAIVGRAVAIIYVEESLVIVDRLRNLPFGPGRPEKVLDQD